MPKPGKAFLFLLIAPTIVLAAVYIKNTRNPKQQGSPPPSPTPHLGQYQPTEYTPAQLQAKLQTDREEIIVVDVRSSEEYAQGHLPGAINIPYDDTQSLTQLDKNKEIVVYCTLSAWRAPYAAYTLSKNGYSKIALLKGGAKAWEKEIGQLASADSPNAGVIIPKPSELVPKSPTQVNEITISNRPFTKEILSYYNGQNGRPAYVAVDGIVYDVSESPLWQNGVHRPAILAGFVEVKAGRDLTNWLKFSPHGKKNLQRFPIVGYLTE